VTPTAAGAEPGGPGGARQLFSRWIVQHGSGGARSAANVAPTAVLSLALHEPSPAALMWVAG
jgi:hypothetical protein